LKKILPQVKEEKSQGNWTDILMKNDGKSVLVGDHGGRVVQK
jgi:hypothetical protein